MLARIAFPIASVAFLAAASAAAVDVPNSLTAPPYGPGTSEDQPSTKARAVAGPDAQALIGGGFGDYGFGLGARVGYTFNPGIYAGASTTYYFGRGVQGATGESTTYAFLAGGELGYKIFPTERWELRPYAFVGPSVMKNLNDAGVPQTHTRFVFYPGLLGAYHFGNAYISAEARTYIAPNPSALALMAGFGLSW